MNANPLPQSPQARLDYIATMYTPEHTPSPWYVNLATSLDNATEAALAVFPATVAEGMTGSTICKVSPLSQLSDTDLFNASAIAATPQLLETTYALLERLLAEGDEQTLVNLNGEINAVLDVFTQALTAATLPQ